MINSQKKGKNFEREIAKDLEKKFGVRVMRTPCSGGIHDFHTADLMIKDTRSLLYDLHIECKKRESLSVMKVYDDTKLKAGGKIPIVIWSKNLRPSPLVIIGYEDFFKYVEDVETLSKT